MTCYANFALWWKVPRGEAPSCSTTCCSFALMLSAQQRSGQFYMRRSSLRACTPGSKFKHVLRSLVVHRRGGLGRGSVLRLERVSQPSLSGLMECLATAFAKMMSHAACSAVRFELGFLHLRKVFCLPSSRLTAVLWFPARCQCPWSL